MPSRSRSEFTIGYLKVRRFVQARATLLYPIGGHFHELCAGDLRWPHQHMTLRTVAQQRGFSFVALEERSAAEPLAEVLRRRTNGHGLLAGDIEDSRRRFTIPERA